MPKMKTKRNAAKRFKISGSGKLLRFKAGARHLLTRKSPKRKRRLRKGGVLTSSMSARIKKMIQG